MIKTLLNMKKKIDIREVFPKHLFWDVKMEKLEVERDKEFIIPRALYATTEDTFEEDIKKIENLYSKKDILLSLKNTKENISNAVCVMVAKRYNAPPFYRFKNK